MQYIEFYEAVKAENTSIQIQVKKTEVGKKLNLQLGNLY